MTLNRKIAIIYGILIIAGITFGILNSVPVLEEPDYLGRIAPIRNQVLLAVFFQAVMATAYVWLAVLAYPLIKKYSQNIALGYFSFRIIGAIFLFVGIVSLILLLFTSEAFVAAGQPAGSHFQTLGEVLRIGRDGFNHIAMILPWTIGGLLLYYCFFKMDLLPKWLSIWGIIGSILTLAATILLIFDVIKIPTVPYFALNGPTAFFELFLAGYLIAKGFKPSAV